MTTFTAARAASTKPPVSVGWGLDTKKGWGIFSYGGTAAPAAADTIVMVRLPKGALVFGGALKGDKLDSNGTGSSLLSVNIGFDKGFITATGTTYGSASASNALASNWPLGSDAVAVTSYQRADGVRIQPLGGLLLTDGPLLMTDETNVVVVVNASALAVTTGDLILEIDYYMAQHS